MISLPEPPAAAGMDVFEAIRKRRSRRSFAEAPLPLASAAAVLFYTAGLTGARNHHRAAPSAGGIHAITVRLVAREVEGLEPGVYRYLPLEHALELHFEGDVRQALCAACLGQRLVFEAPAALALSADIGRIAARYGGRAERYAALDCGHYAQNAYLACEALGLGTCGVGAFRDAEVASCLRLPENERPLYVLPFGEVTE